MTNRKIRRAIICRSGEFEAPLEQKAKIPACFGSEILWKRPAAVKETLKHTPPEDYDGQRCALLTTKSRKTCTRATVFNSSG